MDHEPTPLVPRPSPNADARRARLLDPALPYCDLPWSDLPLPRPHPRWPSSLPRPSPREATDQELRVVEAGMGRRAIRDPDGHTVAGEKGQARDDDTATARRIGVRNRDDRLTSARVRYEAIQARAGVSVEREVEDEYRKDIREYVRASRALRDGPHRRGWRSRSIAVTVRLAKLLDRRRAWRRQLREIRENREIREI